MSDHLQEDCKNTGCVYCKRYINYIKTLQSLLDDNGIEYREIKSFRKGKDKVVPDTMLQIDLTEGRLEHLVSEYYTEETFLRGYKGVIDFIHTYVVRDDENSQFVYVCGDSTKKVFHYYDVEGLQRDTRCKVLMDAIYDPLIQKVNKIYRILINRIYVDDDVLVVGNDSSDDENDDEYDSDIEEVIAEELHDKKIKDIENSSKTVDEKVNNTVSLFLEIKKCIGKVRKPVVDELVSLLTL